MIKRLKRMFGISAPRVAVRTAIPWYLRWLALAVVATAILLVSRAAYDFGKKFAGFDQSEAHQEVQRLRDANASLQQDLAQLRAQVAQSDPKLQMERATYADLVKQVKVLTQENAAIKEDLAFFQTLMPAGSKEGGVAVSRFLVQNDTVPGEYRYRLLLTQTGERKKDFHGHLQLAVNLQQDKKQMVLALPVDNDLDRKAYKLSFRFYQRVEGTFKVAPDAVVKSVQVRVFEQGSAEPKLTQTANAS